MNNTKQILEELSESINGIKKIKVTGTREQTLLELYKMIFNVFKEYEKQNKIDSYNINVKYNFDAFFCFVVKMNINSKTYINNTIIWTNNMLN